MNKPLRPQYWSRRTKEKEGGGGGVWGFQLFSFFYAFFPLLFVWWGVGGEDFVKKTFHKPEKREINVLFQLNLLPVRQ